jgi:hypothetical protein
MLSHSARLNCSEFFMNKTRIPAFLVSLLLVCICDMDRASANVTCSTQTFQTVKSPNNQWIATVGENKCIGNYAFETAITSTVIITSVATPTKKSIVFSIDDAGDTLQRPTVSWSSSTNLMIATINSPFVGTKLSSVSGLTISYAYHTVAH